MSGLRKAKHYDWKDSNLSLFGSDVEKNVKKAAAETEKAWQGAGENPGLQIWRIVKFKYVKFKDPASVLAGDFRSNEDLCENLIRTSPRFYQDHAKMNLLTIYLQLQDLVKVTDWPKEEYGKFFGGDSYIILNTYKDKESDELLYDVHFWIGEESSQDEYGTAAYKTVELDTFLNDKPVQHREVMKFESDLFKSYFKEVQVMKGGADSGFRRVGPKEYKPRLLKFNDEGRNKVKVTEVAYCKESITPDNVYIIDNGLNIFQVNGSQSDKDERARAMEYVMGLKSERGGAKSEVLGDNFQSKVHLPSGDTSEDAQEPPDEDFKKTIFKLSDESGQLKTTDMGIFSKGVLTSEDVFICDTGSACYVYIGKKASIDERRKGLQYAHNYLLGTKHPLVPVTVVQEGQKCQGFENAF